MIGILCRSLPNYANVHNFGKKAADVENKRA